ncbi:hypothetical protein EN858_00705 [Mesorhizobium sp. M4B.F.Ca.ET.215.01.1.1]|uniref:hypothetical protein n=1 Tax=unclassified Mesorhizobium TaxID=325217 RepID=UPI000FCCDAA5|nr:MULTISPECIES: hypothetical protein [unclassified Mesorhizobium]RUW27479.1 hypothetical protein EOA34_04715 [Mesorhizobium sp. M4B.F.Ca.ET.013.02.1.1]RVD45863.1 hypothetical protein EN741_03555 [Mesorhizobium sp. M4B.F.Ca.ET.019.03.1.1]RWF64662.1 MAG: hypothetical protein EOS47_13900 [Mesorhizobium sp.]TGQ18362.1 hypothetical protein EN858_00705 [Mesorhizobium sp. M4B.F.Ca.ET.215.01.1.1]TGQ37155.1 hypothetical protein EN857_16570 [Mesorhizobium sp. M4B.F.Ca.ET.214.01.1.1]
MPLTVGIVDDDCYRVCRSCLLSTMLALAACSSSGPVEQESKIAASASQTAVMVMDAWAAGAAPSNYASATLQSTAEALVEVGRQIESDNPPESPKRREVVTAVGQLSAAAKDAQAGVEAGNLRQVSQARQELRAATANLAAAYAKYFAPKS